MKETTLLKQLTAGYGQLVQLRGDIERMEGEVSKWQALLERTGETNESLHDKQAALEAKGWLN